jgi:hypothetical protein
VQNIENLEEEEKLVPIKEGTADLPARRSKGNKL